MIFSFEEDARSEDARSEVRGFFEEAMQTAAQETLTLFDELVAIYTREQYKPLWEMTDEIGTYYAEDFKNMIRGQFEKWLESESSLQAFALEMEAAGDASDDSLMSAQSLENDLSDVIDDVFNNLPDVPTVSTVVRLTKDIEETFDEVADLLQKYETTIEELQSDTNARAETNSEENQIYANVSEILNAALASYLSLFSVFKEGVGNLSEHINQKGQSARAKSESDKEQMSSAAETSGEALKDVSGLFYF